MKCFALIKCKSLQGCIQSNRLQDEISSIQMPTRSNESQKDSKAGDHVGDSLMVAFNEETIRVTEVIGNIFTFLAS